MIWSGTTHLGMGLAISQFGTTYVVARYSPPGNYIGQSPAQGSKSGGKQMPTPGRQPRPGQRDSGGTRRPTHDRQHRHGQRDSGRKHGKYGGFQPPFQHAGPGSMQSPWPYQPFPPGSSGHGSPYSMPPLQADVLGPYDVNNWMTNPHLAYSPYGPWGPLARPHQKRASATHSTSTGCCVIL